MRSPWPDDVRVLRSACHRCATAAGYYRLPTPEQARLLDKAFELPGMFERLRQRQRGIPFSADFRPFAPHEAEATTLETFQHVLVPGLFQTVEYAHTVLESYPGISAEDVRDQVAARLRRQELLDRENPPWLWALLDEQVLVRNVGGPEIMAAQLARLAELARRPKITIQVLPADLSHPRLNGAFVIAGNSQPPAVVYLEGALDGHVVEDQQTAQRLAVMFDSLRTEALPGDASLNLIEDKAQQWQQRITP